MFALDYFAPAYFAPTYFSMLGDTPDVGPSSALLLVGAGG